MAELGAGLAHELNNPLAAILGITQLLAQAPRGAGDEALLASLEQQVARCASIVRALLAFTEDAARPAVLEELDLEDVLAEVAALATPAYRQRGLTLVHARGERRLPVHADRTQLAQALAQLASSLRALLPEGGRLRLRASERATEVLVELALEGQAGATRPIQKDDWLAAGMSLWIARRILSEHGGRLIEPPADRVAPFLLLMPKAQDE
ncbi:MAG: histidine kinase dimerization/phospho-acceptor domain-containing protein [Pseudomonadota bacterium]